MFTVGLIYNLKNFASSEQNKTSVSAGSSDDKYLEWDEMDTILEIKKALEEHTRVILIEANETLWNKLRRYKKDLNIVFIVAEGLTGSGREAAVPIMLEELKIPYTGSDPGTLILCLNKERTKQILAYHRVRYPLHKVFTEVPELTVQELAPLEFPVLIKPLWEGSSKGIRNSSLVMNLKECQREVARIIQMYKQPALVEEFVPGREFTVGVLGNGDDIHVLPIVELNFSSLPKGASPIYSYEAKWIWDVPQKPLEIFTCPAELTSSLERKIKDTAVTAYNALGCRDWCRIDIRLDKSNRPFVLELNPIPGILPNPKSNSCLPKAARALGWDYNKLINTVLAISAKRCGIEYEKLLSYSL